MSRLTPKERDEGWKNKVPIGKALDKLAHYEDLEEQQRLIELDFNCHTRDELDRCTHRHCNNCDKYRRELKHYKDLEEAGRLIKLPCKVGDRVWEIHHRAWDGYADDWLYPDYTRSIVQECGFGLNLLSSIGSTVFLTKAEAEAKLAELKGGAE